MPTLADAAAAALAAAAKAAKEAQEKANQDLLDAAERTLAAVLGEAALAAVSHVEDVDLDAALVVVSDTRTYLAVAQAGTEAAAVWLVEPDGGWRQVAPITSLADLGAALADQNREG